ncbi:hypothetical protein LZ31DRAFT_334537 [Colletotrichum somersetense]|nr:hypothetical protein LZ31DRAFT_334537 [Colletotrichum somersetense]
MAFCRIASDIHYLTSRTPSAPRRAGELCHQRPCQPATLIRVPHTFPITRQTDTKLCSAQPGGHSVPSLSLPLIPTASIRLWPRFGDYSLVSRSLSFPPSGFLSLTHTVASAHDHPDLSPPLRRPLFSPSFPRVCLPPPAPIRRSASTANPPASPEHAEGAKECDRLQPLCSSAPADRMFVYLYTYLGYWVGGRIGCEVRRRTASSRWQSDLGDGDGSYRLVINSSMLVPGHLRLAFPAFAWPSDMAPVVECSNH